MQLFSTYPKDSLFFGFFFFFCTFLVQFPFYCPVFSQSVSPISKDYLVELQKNKKANITVHLVDNPNKKIENKHTFLKVNYKSALTFDFSPMKIKRESQKKLYGNYVKAGIGNFQNSYAEAFFNTRRSEKQSYGVYLKHTNLREGAIDARNSADAQNKLVFSFQSFSKKGVFTGKVGLQQQQWHFYGYQRTDPIPAAKDIQQDFITFEGQIGYTNKLEASKNYHDIGLFYHYWADRYAAKEQEIGGEFSKKINFNVNNKLFFKANVSSSMRSDEVGSIQRNLLNTELYHQINYSKLYLQIGLRAALHNDTLKEMEKAFLYPKLYLSFSLFKNKLDVFLQLDGGMQKRLMRDMVSENPYLVANTPLLHTNKTWESSLGFRTKLANGINWQASASYGFYQYLYFFMNSSTFPSKFFVQYETAITPVSTFISEFSASFGKFRAKLCTELQKYELKTLQSAWHRPLVKNTLSVGYSIEKFAINVDIYHLEGIKAFDVISSQQKDLQPITDVNMKIDYQFSPMWSVFAKGSNLLSQQYQRFLYYDARTAQVMAGASLTF